MVAAWCHARALNVVRSAFDCHHGRVTRISPRVGFTPLLLALLASSSAAAAEDRGTAVTVASPQAIASKGAASKAPGKSRKPASSPLLIVPVGTGQSALAVGLSAGGLRLRVCPGANCSLAGSTNIPLPDEVQAHVALAQLTVLKVARGRRVLHVRLKAPKSERAWEAVVAAPTGGGSKAKILFADWTGLMTGPPGDRRGPMVVAHKEKRGGSFVAIGSQREEVSLCGRSAMLGVKVVTRDLGIQRARVPRLGPEEMRTAPRLMAEAIEAPAASALLRARVASSAKTSPQALTDGRLDTAWIEQRRGTGRGEFVVMDAPSELKISGFDFSLAPRELALSADAKKQIVEPPLSFWILGDQRAVRVDVPKNQKAKGQHFRVTLPKPWSTECVAVVLDKAASRDPKVAVGLAEFQARSSLAASSNDELVTLLDAGGAKGRAASRSLRGRGAEAADRVIHGYDKLTPEGQVLALGALEDSECSKKSPILVSATLHGSPELVGLAGGLLQQCGAASADAIEGALDGAKTEELLLLTPMLSKLSPTDTLTRLAKRFDGAKAPAREILREAWGNAAEHSEAQNQLSALLQAEDAGESRQVEMLRALASSRAGLVPEAVALIERLWTPKASFRTRYLLLPAVFGLDESSPLRKRIEEQALGDPRAEIRAAASRGASRASAPRLLRLLEDENVRVREAVVTRLRELAHRPATQALVVLLANDVWPLVRHAAALALGSVGLGAEVDRALIDALDDPSAKVRRGTATAIGVTGRAVMAPALLDSLDDKDEGAPVRASAARALGQICHAASADVLTTYAAKLGSANISGDERMIGRSALLALGDIAPADLATRLQVLTAKGSPHAAQRAAADVMSRAGACGRAKSAAAKGAAASQR